MYLSTTGIISKAEHDKLVRRQEETAAKRILVHDDGPCSNGQENTPLENGFCPVCGITPDMQSTAIFFYCPVDNVRLGKGRECPVCGGFYTK